LGLQEFLLSRVSKIKMPAHHPSSFFCAVEKRKTRDTKKQTNVVVQKHVRQLGEKSNRRIISRLDGTAVFGRECGRERVWGRFWFSFFLFLWLSFVLLKRVNVVVVRDEEQRTHFLSV